MNKCKLLLFVIISCLLTACASDPAKHIDTKNWNKATAEVVHEYRMDADKRLEPYFKKADVAFPPKQIALLVFKQEHNMELWAEDKVEIKIKLETEPIAKQVKELKSEVVQITFDSKQILLILEKTTDKRIIKEVREETEKFRPKVDSGK